MALSPQATESRRYYSRATYFHILYMNVSPHGDVHRFSHGNDGYKRWRWYASLP